MVLPPLLSGYFYYFHTEVFEKALREISRIEVAPPSFFLPKEDATRTLDWIIYTAKTLDNWQNYTQPPVFLLNHIGYSAEFPPFGGLPVLAP